MLREKEGNTQKLWITSAESCSNIFWHISLNSDSFHPVSASIPAMANPICFAYSSQTCFLSCFYSSASAAGRSKEASRPGCFDVFLRKKSAFHKNSFLSTPGLIRRSIGECAALIAVYPLGGCHGRALLMIHSDTYGLYSQRKRETMCTYSLGKYYSLVGCLGEIVT